MIKKNILGAPGVAHMDVGCGGGGGAGSESACLPPAQCQNCVGNVR